MARIDSQAHLLARKGPLMEPPRLKLTREGRILSKVGVLAEERK